MFEDLSLLEPKSLWFHFGDICAIPPSKHEEAILAYIRALFDEKDLEHYQDAIGNIIVRKPASPGLEKLKMVTLQAHVDMVPQKNMDKVHDFVKDPIQPLIEGEWVKAQGTTLGADDGIGVATILGVMKKNHVKVFDYEAKVMMIHAGLECGLIKATHPDMEMISFGPTIRFPHSPFEKVKIATVKNFWELLLFSLKSIPLAQT